MFECYGVMLPALTYHVSNQCPKYKVQIMNKKWHSCRPYVNAYTDEAAAIMAGHVQRCKVCHGMYRFDVKVNGVEAQFLLNKRHYNVLMCFAWLIERNRPISLVYLEKYMSLSAHQICDTLTRLTGKRLIYNPINMRNDKFTPGKRRLSSWGIAVVQACKRNLYLAPAEIDDATDVGVPYERLE